MFFLQLSCFFHDPIDVGNLISGSFAFLNPAWTSGSSWFMYRWSLAWRILSMTLLACEMSALVFLQNGLVGSPCSPRDSQESSPTPQFQSINSSALSLPHSPTLTSYKMENIGDINFRLLFADIIVFVFSIHWFFLNSRNYLNIVTIKEVIDANTETADNQTPTELLELIRLWPVLALLGSTYTISFCCR